MILYIEDNPQNMRLVRKMLQGRGYTMMEAIDGTSGLDLATNQNPELILVDINLPDIDGMEVTRRIRRNTSLNHIPIIAVTANAMYGDRERCIEAGCDAYLAKPISNRELISAVEQFLTGAAVAHA